MYTLLRIILTLKSLDNITKYDKQIVGNQDTNLYIRGLVSPNKKDYF